MTAIPLSLTAEPTITPRTPADPAKWIAVDEAAERLDVSPGQLRRRCQQQLQHQDLAIRALRERDGSICWHVARHYDRRLKDSFAEALHRTPTLEGFTRAQIEQGRQRAACVEALKEARSTWRGDQKTWLPTLVQQLRKKHPELTISERSLRRWYRLYRTPSDLPKLIDRRGGNQKGEADPAAWDYFRSIFLDEREPTLLSCWQRSKEYARAEGLTWCSYDQCRKKLDEKVPPDLRAQFRSPKTWRDSFSPYVEMHPEHFAAGECWIGDHAQLDVWCHFNGKLIRPWLTAWMDWRTRRLVGWVLSESPNSSTILAALRVGLLDETNLGSPDQVCIDNGKDYASYCLTGQTKAERKQVQRTVDRFRVDETQAGGIFNQLGIEAHFSIPRNPKGKGRLERWFKVVHGNFDSTFASYTGSSPETRPETLAAILKRQDKVPTFDHLRERLADFITGHNANADHQREDMKGLSPDQALARWAKRRRKMADPAALDELLQHWERPVSVGRNGVAIKPRGYRLTYGQHDPQLAALKRTGRKVRVAYDPADLRTVKVYDEQWRFICEVGMNGGVSAGKPVTGEHVKEMLREQRRYKATKRDMRRHYQHEYLSSEELLAQQAERPEQAPADLPLNIVRTVLDGQSEAVQSDRQRKNAVAEGDDGEAIDLLDFAGPFTREAGAEDMQRGHPLDEFKHLLRSAQAEADEDGRDLLDELDGLDGGKAGVA